MTFCICINVRVFIKFDNGRTDLTNFGFNTFGEAQESLKGKKILKNKKKEQFFVTFSDKLSISLRTNNN